MFIRQRFECELCHHIYEDEDACRACEKSHDMTVHVVNARWSHGDKVPTEIQIISDTGERTNYVREDLGWPVRPRKLANWQIRYMQNGCP